MDSVYSVKAVKFGGSSLANAEQFKKVANIILSDSTRKYVIPSAPGKRFSGDDKVTDLLLKCHKASVQKDDYSGLLTRIKERYNEIINELKLNCTLDNEFEIIENNLKDGCSIDYMASRGEYLNGILLANYLGFEFIDSAQVIFFAEDGTFDAEKTNDCLSKVLENTPKAVIPGFYGSDSNGKVKIFSRGGSDITGAIVARAAKADIYENWTDVSGFLMCDPRIVKNPKPIKVITYKELRELSYMGATVLHEDAIFPVKQAGIPINIRNTNRPEDDGTLIVPKAPATSTKEIITGIAGKKDFAIIHIEKDMMNRELGFGMRVLKVLSDLGISFEHLPSGIDTMSVVVNEQYVETKENEILRGIKEAVNPDTLEIETGLALIAIVGRGMVKASGTASRAFSAIASRGINIRMIDQGSSELNIIIGIAEIDFEAAIRAIYEEFVTE